MVAIDKVTIAPNSEAASGATSWALLACANNTKPNSPPWLSSTPSPKAERHVMRKASPISVITPALVAISASAITATNNGRSAIA